MTLSAEEESHARITLARMTDDQLRQELLVMRHLVAALEERQVRAESRIAEIESERVRWQMDLVDERRRRDREDRREIQQLHAKVQAMAVEIARLKAAKPAPRTRKPADAKRTVGAEVYELPSPAVRRAAARIDRKISQAKNDGPGA